MRTDTAVSLSTISLKNPVLVASGTFGYGDETRDLLDLRALGGIITKTITLRPRDGNPPPRLAETSGGMLNTIGLQNIGVERFLDEKWEALRRLPVPVIVSVAGETAQEYVDVVRRLGEAKGLAGIELNLSCPNLKKRIICQDAALVTEIVSKTAKAVRAPVIAKLSPQVADLPGLAAEAERAGADALALVNTFPGMAINADTWEPRLSTVTGGLSGPAIKPLALRCVWEVSGRVRIPIIGGGGIMTGTDVAEFLLAGATAVSVGTANFADPAAPAKIADEFGKYLRAKKLDSPAKLVRQLKV